MVPIDQNQDSGQALVLSSDSETSNLIARLLDAEGYASIECADPNAIDNCIADPSPAVIVVDAAIASGDPLDLCLAIRQWPGCDFIPLLLLSTDCEEADAARAYDRNVTTVIAKPVDEDVFKKHIRSLGDTGRTLSGIRALRMPESNLFQTMPDAFFVVGKDGLLRQYLGGANDDSVLAPESMEGQMVNDIWPPEVTKSVLLNIKRVLRSRDGHAFDIELPGQDSAQAYEIRLLVQGRDKVLMIIRNITKSPGSGTGPRVSDSSDALTGLVTRDEFIKRFESILANARLRERGVAVLSIDIDRFSRINDTLGRAVGDAVLKVSAQRIERCLRGVDAGNTCLTRMGGDEFVLILADIDSREDVDSVASRVQESFLEPVSIEGHTLVIVPSIGISLYPLDGENTDELLKNSRVALDEAKVMSAQGREFFSNTMKFRARKRFDVKNELRWAIEKEQLELHYLPRIDLVTGRAAGLEALLRWMHPLRGSVPLSEVIPLAEATGLIFPIGEWVLRAACEHANTWQPEDETVPAVSINLSQQEFARDDLVELIGRSLEESGLPANRLELELTEGMLMRNRRAEAVVKDLHDMGVGIVLDDFGQGHSSIANLTSLPIKAIKIDRAFVDGARVPGEQQAICSAIIAMSRELGITVIAEGVECQSQVDFFRERGCDAVQGFLFSEPLPADRVPAFLTACVQAVDKTGRLDLGTVCKEVRIKAVS